MKFLPTNVKVKISEKHFFGLFEKIFFQGAWRKEGAHSYQHLTQRRNSHSLVTISLFSLSGDLYLLSNPNNCFLYPVWPWSPRKLVWANWWHLSFFFSVCLSLRSFSAFFVSYIVSVTLIIASFLQVDLGRQEGWFGPKRGVYLGGRLEVSCLPIWDESRKNIESKIPKIKNLE